MSRSPQDVYARYLLSSRGYPLWIPEPSQELLLTRRDGLRIGDVGVVVPEDGGFEVFFNICLPPEHPFHRSTGVPDNFKHVELHDTDIRIIPRVENPGRIISTSSVTNIRTIEPPSGTTSAQFGGLGYEFDLSSSGGAVLILPEGAERYDLRNHRLFHEEATRCGVGWYHFAEERLGRMISHDSLYLITGFYKTRSWSLAAFENVAGSAHFSAQFKMAQIGGSDMAGSYTWETARSLDWRAGPEQNYGFANQSVFIRGFKVALRTGFLGKKRIEVKADAPSTASQHSRFSPPIVRRDPGMSNSWKGLSGGSHLGTDVLNDEVVARSLTARPSDDDSIHGTRVDEEKYVVVQSMPEPSEMFHPSDTINRYLFEKEPSANIAVTHDDDWILLLEKGELKPEDFVRVDSSLVGATVAKNFNVVSQDGVVFIQAKINVTDDSPPAFPSMGMQESVQESFGLTLDEGPPPPAYDSIENTDRDKYPGVSEKSHLLPQLPAFRQPLGIHWQLLPYNQRTSRHLVRFDVIFPVDRICYQYGNNVREGLTEEALDEAALDEPITKMRIIFKQRPFSWTIYVDNSRGIRCRDVFEAIYDFFNQQLTLGELWRVPDREACGEAFRIRNLVLGTQTERSRGWKRVDVLLHHTIFHGLTMNSESEGDWVLNLGAPLPVSDLPQALSLSRRDSPFTDSEEGESADEDAYLPPSLPPIHPRGSTKEEAIQCSTSQRSASSALSRPGRRPLGPRPIQS